MCRNVTLTFWRHCNIIAPLTLIQLCGVRTDPAVTEIVTLLEWKVIDKSPHKGVIITKPFAMM